MILTDDVCFASGFSCDALPVPAACVSLSVLKKAEIKV